MTHLVIAIDGPAASGKGTLARRLAQALGLLHLDTGLLYRATARRVLEEGLEPMAAARRVVPADLSRTDLRTPEIDRLASAVAADPGVRAALLDTQRYTARSSGAVLDGRDIGTVVFPDADLKLFVTASPEARARRRLLQREPERTPDAAMIAAEAASLEARDRADSERLTAPLVQASDAVLIETSTLDADQAFAHALALARHLLDRAGDAGL